MTSRATKKAHRSHPPGRWLVNPMRLSVVAVLFVVALGIVAIGIYLPQAMRHAARETALQSNLDVISHIKMVRGYYTKNILSRLVAEGGLKPSMDYHDHPHEVPLPATLVKDLSELMAHDETTLSLVSPYPWPHRAGRKMTEFEQQAWDAFQARPDAVVTREEVVEGKRVLRVAVADRMTTQACVNCHNADPQSSRRDWKIGDVRAVFEVSRVIESVLHNAEVRSQYIVLAIAIGAGVGSLLLVGFMLLIERHSRAKRLADQQAYYLAEHDVLTGLHNRARLCAVLDAAFARSGPAGYTSLLLIDLDRFKPVNDTYGHGTGDHLLKAVAGRLRAACRDGDVIARLGGDEFAILMAGPPGEDHAAALAQRLCKMLAEPFEIDGQALTIGASIGIARLREHAGNTTDLMIAADLALYAAKAAGRGTAVPFTAELTIAALKRRHLEADLREALHGGGFEIHYQPIGSIATGRVTKFEALLRWNHPERGAVSPGEFIPLAEETGLIVPIGAWVIRRACVEMAKIDLPIKVAVNLSPAQLQHDMLLPMLKDALDISGLDPGRLEVEITESIMMQNDGKTLALLNAIRALGVEIAMDDFGTGYSCLSYLQNYPINCIKIDQSFVRTLGQADNARPIISAIIALAHALGMQTVAEGVETREQLLALASLQCDEVQGFYFGRPKPMREIRLGRSAGEDEAAKAG
jgi:diguanylate cyclase (GGDEF)-like protein